VKQFILDSGPDREGIVRVTNSGYRYLVHVRRLAAGEYFRALLPGGEETNLQVLSVKENVLTCKCSSPLPPSASCEPHIILMQALPKADKMDLIVRQAAEGGIAEIIPFISEFSVVRTNVAGQKFSRWERIIKEARQQSGSKVQTIIRKPVSTEELFEHWNEAENSAVGLIFHHIPDYNGGEGLENKSLHRYLDNNLRITALAIGPEGGFSAREISLFIQKSFKPFTIGSSILRTETAALYCAAAVKILLLERESWKLK